MFPYIPETWLLDNILSLKEKKPSRQKHEAWCDHTCVSLILTWDGDDGEKPKIPTGPGFAKVQKFDIMP